MGWPLVSSVRKRWFSGQLDALHCNKILVFVITISIIRRSSTINANRGVPLDSIALPGNFDGLECSFHCQQCLNVTGSAGYRGFPILIKQLFAEKTNKQKNKQKQLIIFNSFTLVFTHICIRYENK